MEIMVGKISLGTVTRVSANWYNFESPWEISGAAKSHEEACEHLLAIYCVIKGANLLRAKPLVYPVSYAVEKWNMHFQRLGVIEGYKRDCSAWERSEEERRVREDQLEREARLNRLVKSISPHQVAAVIAAKAIKRPQKVPVPVRHPVKRKKSA